MKTIAQISIGVLLLMLFNTPVTAQKGRGDETGISRSGANPEIMDISGKVLDIKSGPCELTTGRYSTGTHLIVQKDDNTEINVHIGPTAEVSSITDELSVGDEISMKVFTTPDLPENQFIAKELQIKGENYNLRDDTLRPFWAGQGRRNR